MPACFWALGNSLSKHDVLHTSGFWLALSVSIIHKIFLKVIPVTSLTTVVFIIIIIFTPTFIWVWQVSKLKIQLVLGVEALHCSFLGFHMHHYVDTVSSLHLICLCYLVFLLIKIQNGFIWVTGDIWRWELRTFETRHLMCVELP